LCIGIEPVFQEEAFEIEELEILQIGLLEVEMRVCLITEVE